MQLPPKKTWGKSPQTTPTQSHRAPFPADLWSRGANRPSVEATTWTCRCPKIRHTSKSRTRTLLLNNCKRDASPMKLARVKWARSRNYPTKTKWSLLTPCTILQYLRIKKSSTKLVINRYRISKENRRMVLTQGTHALGQSQITVQEKGIISLKSISKNRKLVNAAQ